MVIVPTSCCRALSIHFVPYTKSRSTRSPEVHEVPEGHEVDCAGDFQRYSLKTMKKELLKQRLPRPAEVYEHVAAMPDDSASVTNPATRDEQEREILSPTDAFDQGETMPTGLKQLSPQSLSVKQSSSSKETEGSFPPPSGASPMESRRLADTNPAASVPLRGKPFEINGSSGPAARSPFFCKDL